MAEFVQSRLEDSLSKFIALEKLDLFSVVEIKKIINRIKSAEYRLERVQKSKQDYLKYIEYLSSLLSLIQIRRKKTSNWSNREEVEFVIDRNIKRLYKDVIRSNKWDVELWQSFITVSREKKWFSTVGRLYAEMLKCHSYKPELWVSAAKWDYEENVSVECARKTLLRGIRFNKKSKILYQELFELELKQSEIELSLTAEGVTSKKRSKKNRDVYFLANTSVAEAVYRKAVEEMDDVEFAVSFLQLCAEYKFSTELQERIIADLQEKYNNCEVWRKTWALRPLKLVGKENYSIDDAETECIKRFDEAVDHQCSQKMWTYYLEFCLEKLKKNELQNKSEFLQHTLNVFSRAGDAHCLSKIMLQQWVKIAAKHDDKLSCKVLRYAIKKYPSEVSFWEDKVRYSIKHGLPHVKLDKIIKKALTSIQPNDVLNLWKIALSLYVSNDPDKVEPFFEAGLSLSPSVASQIKVLHLQWTFSVKGYESAWNLYKRIWSIPPICWELFKTMQEMIEYTPNPSIKRLRKVVRAAQNNYGKSSIDVWIESMNIERKYSTIEDSQISRVYEQAIKTLEGNLVDQFIVYHTLQTTKLPEDQ